jgi:prepilin-type processing-associated H-X9-DG protein/prepilin-type N-terminal cleavage/methylation domain-containing protein
MYRSDGATVKGFTVVELLIVIAVVSLLASLAVPAIQHVYAAALRTRCQSDLRQVGGAALGYAGIHGHLPSGFRARVRGPLLSEPSVVVHNYYADLLPHLDALSVAEAYNYEIDFADEANWAALQTTLEGTLCSAAPKRGLGEPTEYTVGNDLRRLARGDETLEKMSEALDQRYRPNFRGAPVDYVALAGVAASTVKALGFPVPKDPRGGSIEVPVAGAFPLPTERWDEFREKLLRIAKAPGTVELSNPLPLDRIVDGLSTTVLMVEVAGRPQHWTLGRPDDFDRVNGSEWGHPRNLLVLEGGEQGRCLVQCDNRAGIYSFHSGGANIVFADGHVEFLAADVDPRRLVRLIAPDDVGAGLHTVAETPR